MDSKSTKELQEHMMGTYYGLRVGLAVIGIALPLVVLFAGGVLHHVWLKPSISQYYHPGEGSLSYFTTRDFFVGGLFAAGESNAVRSGLSLHRIGNDCLAVGRCRTLVLVRTVLRGQDANLLGGGIWGVDVCRVLDHQDG